MHVGLGGVAWRGDLLEAGLAVRAELIELGQVLGGVLIELEEACGVVVNVGVAEVVELVAEGVLHVLLELGGVLGSMDVKLACGVLQTVGLRS